jgi:starvation-inducible DNA-binding protein
MALSIGLSESNRDSVVKILNNVLADEYVLYTKTRNYHWNVVGPQFNDLHKFFESQYEALNDIVDEVAERARSLGGKALGTLAEFSQHTRLKEQPGKQPPALTMVANLQSDHEALVRTLRADLATVMEKHNDAGTSDFLTGLMEKHEKMAWMLRAFNEKWSPPELTLVRGRPAGPAPLPSSPPAPPPAPGSRSPRHGPCR